MESLGSRKRNKPSSGSKSKINKKHSKKKSKPPRKKHKRHYSESSDTDSDDTITTSGSGSDPSPAPPRHKKTTKKKESKKSLKRKKRHQERDRTRTRDAGHIAKQPTNTNEGASSVHVTCTETRERVHQEESDIAKLKATLAAQTSKPRGPMTKEEYEKQQSVVRRVYDPDTGRHRLVKGDGEIIEEIVSRDRQKAINKQATLGDGLSFQAQMKRLL